MSVLQRLQPYPGLRVLISGGAAGIGEVLAAAYLEAGAQVHVCDVSEPALAAFRDKYPGTVATRADVSDAAQIEAVFQVQREQFGGLAQGVFPRPLAAYRLGGGALGLRVAHALCGDQMGDCRLDEIPGLGAGRE